VRVAVDPTKPLTPVQEVAALLTPLERAVGLTQFDKLIGAGVALVVEALMHPGGFGLALLLATSFADFRLGRAVSRARGDYRPDLAQLGKIGKIAGILIVLFLAAVEIWIYHHPGWPNTHGLVSGVLAFWLAIDDGRSIVRHMKATGKNVPHWLDSVLGAAQAEIDLRSRHLPKGDI
jgi:hypothetical protein